LFAGLLLLSDLIPPPLLRAQEPLRDQTSLKFIPDDAAFYGSSLRMKQQLETFIRSRAFARLRDSAITKVVVEEIQRKWNAAAPNPAEGQPDAVTATQAPDSAEGDDEAGDESFLGLPSSDLDAAIRDMKDFWSDSENRKLVALGLDALSQEVFFYGDNNFIDCVRAFQKFNGELTIWLSVGYVQPVMEFWLHSLDKFPTPAFVVGAKLSDEDGARSLLVRVETAVRESLQEFPEIARELHREKIGSGEFLTLRLDGSKIRWNKWLGPYSPKEGSPGEDEVPCGTAKFPKTAKEPPDAEPGPLKMAEIVFFAGLANAFKDRSVTLSLGVLDGYLLFSFGETNAHLAKCVANSPRLIDREEFALLRKFADKPLTSIRYVSAEFSRVMKQSWDHFDSVFTQFAMLGAMAMEENAAQTRRLAEIKALAAETIKLAPEPGALLHWQYLTPDGYESFSYDYGGGDKALDGSQQLTILEHVGDEPLIVFAARHKGQSERNQLWARQLAVLIPTLDLIPRAYLSDEYAATYSSIKKAVMPLVKRLQVITAGQLLPALADGQSALIVDAQSRPEAVDFLSTGEFFVPRTGPARLTELPLPAPALVYGITDARLFERACDSYFRLLKDAARTLHRLNPEKIPDVELPNPAISEVSGGKMYVFSLHGPEAAENQIALTGVLGANVAIGSLSPEQAQRLLKKSKFTSLNVIRRIEQPAARIWYVNIAGLTDRFVEPWIMHYSAGAVKDKDFFRDQIAPWFQAILEVVECLRRSAGVDYFENGALVEFRVSVFEDLKLTGE
jgi:hypothetical protein